MPLRPPTDEDARAILELLRARDTVDLGVPDVTLEDLFDDWSQGGFDRATDARVWDSQHGEIAAYAIVRRPSTQAAVSPDHEGLGIGVRLLEWVEGRERELGWARHRQAIGAGNVSGRALLEERGYLVTRRHWRMVRALDTPGGPSCAPPGVTLGRLDPERDAASLFELQQACFADSRGHPLPSLSAFRERHLSGSDLDPESSRVARRGDRTVGFLIARRWVGESAGYVDLLAVDPHEQGRGLGGALLELAFASFRELDLGEAQLGVAADNPSALRLYERVGMHARFRVEVYERTLANCRRRASVRAAQAGVPVGSAITSKLLSVTGPNEVISATSTASRPRPTTTRPVRGLLLRASNVYH
jgi:mycothiol synthase